MQPPHIELLHDIMCNFTGALGIGETREGRTFCFDLVELICERGRFPAENIASDGRLNSMFDNPAPISKIFVLDLMADMEADPEIERLGLMSCMFLADIAASTLTHMRYVPVDSRS